MLKIILENGIYGGDRVIAVSEIPNFIQEDMTDTINLWADGILNINEVLANPIFKDRDPWFGFGCIVLEKQVIDEGEFFSKLIPNQKNKLAVEKFLKALIKYNQQDEALISDEDTGEVGIWAFEWFLKADPKKVHLYIDYLKTLDLDHTIEQPNMIESLLDLFSTQDRKTLVDFLNESGGGVFADYISQGRIK